VNSQKEDKNTVAQDSLIKKLKVMVVTLQRSLQINDLKMRRQAQEIRELKAENTSLKEKVKRHG
jgi:cell division protein FtsB